MPKERTETPINARKPHQIDVIAGRNLQLARIRACMSQERLGDAVGISFQQIQKYERGTNRMSLSRAWEFAKVLKIRVADLFDDHALPGTTSLDLPHMRQWFSLYTRASNAGIISDFIHIAGSIIQLREAS